jgi:copper chaperone CopZ
MIETLMLPVTGMTCGGCENAVKRAVMKLEGVEDVSASHRESQVLVRADTAKVSVDAIRRQIEAIGYAVGGPV